MALNNLTFYIISLKFAPGLKKEFFVLGENIRKKGASVGYLLSGNYRKLGKDKDGITYIPMSDGIRGMVLDTFKFFNCYPFIHTISSSKSPSFILFYNPHLLNPRLAYLIKKQFANATLALYLHDPYKPDKSPYGLARSAYFTAAEFIQGLTLKYMDYVISPSGYSSKLFKERYPRFTGENFIAPLLLPDQKIPNTQRRYFSIVGSAHQATGHDTFIEIVNYVAEKKLSYEFALISSSNIDMFLRRLSGEARKILKVINKRIITDLEINEIIGESYAVFRLDQEVTQSGVIPVSFMNETPIIARDIPGLRQDVSHKENGYLIPLGSTPEDIIEAMKFIRFNFKELSLNARKSYERTWAEWNWDKYYSWLIELSKKA